MTDRNAEEISAMRDLEKSMATSPIVDLDTARAKSMYYFFEMGRRDKISKEDAIFVIKLIDWSVSMMGNLKEDTSGSYRRKGGLANVEPKPCPVCGEEYKHLKAHLVAHENNSDEYPVLEAKEK